MTNTSSSADTKRKPDRALTVVGTVVGVLSLIVALGAWWWPQSPEPTPAGTSPGTSSATSDASATRPPAPPIGAPATSPVDVEYLDGSGFPAEAGGARLVSVPRTLRGRPEYASHPIAVKCPSNQAGDESSDVTYLLRGRYVGFEATVRPYYPAGADQKAATWVFGLVDVKLRDGTYARKETGKQQRATMSAAATLAADVTGADKLILSVRCGDPNGTVVLTDARLTPAD